MLRRRPTPRPTRRPRRARRFRSRIRCKPSDHDPPRGVGGEVGRRGAVVLSELQHALRAEAHVGLPVRGVSQHSRAPCEVHAPEAIDRHGRNVNRASFQAQHAGRSECRIRRHARHAQPGRGPIDERQRRLGEDEERSVRAGGHARRAASLARARRSAEVEWRRCIDAMVNERDSIAARDARDRVKCPVLHVKVFDIDVAGSEVDRDDATRAEPGVERQRLAIEACDHHEHERGNGDHRRVTGACLAFWTDDRTRSSHARRGGAAADRLRRVS